jgi:hypothetical protein
MATYLVKFAATIEVEIEATSYSEAERLAKTQLDPDVDWDSTDVEQIWPKPEVRSGKDHHRNNR